MKGVFTGFPHVSSQSCYICSRFLNFYCSSSGVPGPRSSEAHSAWEAARPLLPRVPPSVTLVRLGFGVVRCISSVLDSLEPPRRGFVSSCPTGSVWVALADAHLELGGTPVGTSVALGPRDPSSCQNTTTKALNGAFFKVIFRGELVLGLQASGPKEASWAGPTGGAIPWKSRAGGLEGPRLLPSL